jgi:glycosyltransferase involved in cell wall biosynthesis
VEQHVRELAELTAGEVIWLRLAPAPPRLCILECSEDGYQFSLTLDQHAERDLLAAVIGACGVGRVHIHHLTGHSALDSLPQDLGLPFDFTVHDYYTVCPQVTLSDEHGNYCGEPDEAGCNRCLAKRPVVGARDISSWRAMHAWTILRADRVIAPSVDAAERMKRYFPEVRILAAEHATPSPSNVVVPAPLAKRENLRVAVLGTMSIHKGLELLNECARKAAAAGAPLGFVLVGSVHDSDRATPACAQTGRYQPADLPALLKRLAPHVVWFPTRIPETFSYTLSSCLALGLPVAAHDIGAFPARLANRPWSWIVPREFSANDWIDFFLQIRKSHFRPGTAPVPPAPQPAVLQGFYKDGYLAAATAAPARHVPKRDGARRPIRVAAALVEDGPGRIQACGYVRVIQPLTHPAVADTVLLTITPPEALAASAADLILVQRTAVQDMKTAERIVSACRHRGSRLLFEIDDDLFQLPEDHPESDAYATRLEAAKLLARSADAVLTSTEALRLQMLPFNSKTVVLPNYLDDRLWIPPSASKDFHPANIRMVYAGTVSHRDDLEFLGRAVRKLEASCRRQVRLDVVGIADRMSGSDWFRPVPVPGAISASYPHFVAWIRAQNCWHWGLAPLLDTRFNRSKTALKFLEYAALGLPSICSNVPVYCEAVRHEETGLLVENDPDRWQEMLERAVVDAPLWAHLHRACPGVVAANTIAANAQTIRSVYLSLAGREPVSMAAGEALQ